MTVINEDCENKGRPKISDYKYGIPIEDARYILPLATKAHLVVAMNGSRLIDLYSICKMKEYRRILIPLLCDLDFKLPKSLDDYFLFLRPLKGNSSIVKRYYKEKFKKISDDNKVVLLDAFQDAIVRTGLGAVTSTKSVPPSETYEEWGNEIIEKSEAVTKRVTGYGHAGITEQARMTFGMMMSLVSYHQYIRHRLPVNHRESFFDILNDIDRAIIVPNTIKNSEFYKEYITLVNEIKAFRKELFDMGLKDEALSFLLNCDQIKLIASTNARIENDILKERTCMNAQWEIRNLYLKKLKILLGISETLFIEAGPSCLRGSCREGKLSCGRPDMIRSIFQDIQD